MTYPGLAELGPQGNAQQPLEEPQFGFAPLSAQPANVPNPLDTAAAPLAPQQAPMDLASAALMATGQPTGTPQAQPQQAQPQPQPQQGGGGLLGGIVNDVTKPLQWLGQAGQEVQKYAIAPVVGAVSHAFTQQGGGGVFGQGGYAGAQQQGEQLIAGAQSLPAPLRVAVETATNPLVPLTALALAPFTGGTSLAAIVGQYAATYGYTAASDALMAHATSIPGFRDMTPGEQQATLMAAGAIAGKVTEAAVAKLGGVQAISDFLKPTTKADGTTTQPSMTAALPMLDRAQAEVEAEAGPQPVPHVIDTTLEQSAGVPVTKEPTPTTEGGTQPPNGGLPTENNGPMVPAPKQPPSKPMTVGPIALPDGMPQAPSLADKAMQPMRRIFNQTPYDPLASPLGRWRVLFQDRYTSSANMATEEFLGNMQSVFGNKLVADPAPEDFFAPYIDFGPDAGGKVPFAIVAGAPSEYPTLNQSQLAAIERWGTFIKAYADQYEDVTGTPIQTRSDIQPDGFYFPRGRSDLEGADSPMPQGNRWGRGGTPSSLKPVVFENMMDAQPLGYHYASLGDSFRSVILDLSRKIGNQAVANATKNWTDDEGNPLGTTPDDRMSSAIQTQWKDLAQQNVSLRGKINTAMQRAGMNLGTADELDQAITNVSIHLPDQPSQMAKLDDVLAALYDKAEQMQAAQPKERYGSPMPGMGIRIKMPPTANAIAAAQNTNAVGDGIALAADKFARALPDEVDRMQGLGTAIGQTAQRIYQLGQRGGIYAQKADQLQAELNDVQDQIEAMRSAYKAAKKLSQQMPRGTTPIQLNELNGYAFPDRVARVMNSELSKIAPASGNMRGGALASTYMAANDLARSLKFTGSPAWMFIHGLIGAAKLPYGDRSFIDATVTGVRSMADPLATGQRLLQLEDEAAAKGIPGPAQLAVNGGLHYARDVELALREYRDGGSNPAALIARAIQNAPVVRNLNRFWVNGTNMLRVEEAMNLTEQAALHGADMDNPQVLSQIGSSANRMSGYSRLRLGSDFGDALLFAPRLIASQIELVAKGIEGLATGSVSALNGNGFSTDIEQAAAMKSLAALALTMGGTSILANYALGEATGKRVPWNQFFDPLNPEFMRFEFDGEHWSLFGPWDTYLKALIGLGGAGAGMANALAHGNGSNFGANLGEVGYEFRRTSSPLVGTIVDKMVGTNIIGQKATPLEMLAQAIFPMALENLPGVPGRENIGAPGLLAQQVGIKNVPLTPTQQLNEIAQAKYGASWAKLMPTQQAAIKQANPNIWQDKVNQMPAGTQRYYQTKASLLHDQQQDDKSFLAGKISRAQWANNWRSRQQQLLGIQDNAFGASKLVANPKTPSQRYDNIIVENTNPDGTVNWDGTNYKGVGNQGGVDAAIAQLSPQDQAWIADQRSVGLTPVVKTYQQALQLGRKNQQISTLPGYSGIESGQVINAYYNALSYAATHFFSTKPQMVMAALLEQTPGLVAGYNSMGLNGTKIANGALLYAMGALPYLPYAKRANEIANPLIGVFGLGGGAQGALSPAELQTLQKAMNAA